MGNFCNYMKSWSQASRQPHAVEKHVGSIAGAGPTSLPFPTPHSLIHIERCGMHTHYCPNVSVPPHSARGITKDIMSKETTHKPNKKQQPSKATKETSNDPVALTASPVKGTTLFPPVVTPVALGAADPDAPVVPATWKGPVAVGYGGTRLLTVPAAAEEVTADVEPRVVGEG